MRGLLKQQHLTAAWVVNLALAVAAGGAEAVVTVTPDRMQGWEIATNNNGKVELTNRGPAVFERERPFVADDRRNLGRGACYASIGFEEGMTPPTAWLGPGTFDGRPLAGIPLKRDGSRLAWVLMDCRIKKTNEGSRRR